MGLNLITHLLSLRSLENPQINPPLAAPGIEQKGWGRGDHLLSFLGVQRALLPVPRHHLSHSQSLEAFLSRPSPFGPTFSSSAVGPPSLPPTHNSDCPGTSQHFSSWLPVLIPQSQLGGPDAGAMVGGSGVWESYCSELWGFGLGELAVGEAELCQDPGPQCA